MQFSDLVGKTLDSLNLGRERIEFHFSDGTAAESYHSYDCCESVDVDRIEGSLTAILDYPILEAKEVVDDSRTVYPPHVPHDRWTHLDSWTWTRQRLRTAQGEATFVWLGQSNGFYGETPGFKISHGKKI